MQYDRKIERNLDYVRNIIAAQYNTAFGNKKHYTGRKIMPLSFDNYEMEVDISMKEEVEKMLKAWNVHKN